MDSTCSLYRTLFANAFSEYTLLIFFLCPTCSFSNVFLYDSSIALLLGHRINRSRLALTSPVTVEMIRCGTRNPVPLLPVIYPSCSSSKSRLFGIIALVLIIFRESMLWARMHIAIARRSFFGNCISIAGYFTASSISSASPRRRGFGCRCALADFSTKNTNFP